MYHWEEQTVETKRPRDTGGTPQPPETGGAGPTLPRHRASPALCPAAAREAQAAAASARADTGHSVQLLKGEQYAEEPPAWVRPGVSRQVTDHAGLHTSAATVESKT